MSSTSFSYPISDSPKSKIRRKPITTYKSPSAGDIDPLVTFPTQCGVPRLPSEPVQTDLIQTLKKARDPLRAKDRTVDYFLPLYHPFGRLALSLPSLNPTDFGTAPTNAQEVSRKQLARPHGLLTKITDPDGGENIIVPTVSSIAAVAASEMKRASPQKKRLGGGNGKRKRKNPDIEDTIYPVKRTRQTRGGAGDANDLDVGHVHLGEDDMPVVGGPAEQRPERPSTRSQDRSTHDTISINEETLRAPMDSVGEVPWDPAEVKKEGETLR